MGCFDVTCSVSGTQIHWGDDIYLFKLSDYYKKIAENYSLQTQYEVRNRLWRAKKEPDDLFLRWLQSDEHKALEERHAIVDEDYIKAKKDWENKFMSDSNIITESLNKQVDYFHNWKYDDYGWVDWVERLAHEKWIKDNDFIIYVHKWAMEVALEKSEEQIEKMTRWEVVYELICHASYVLNLNLFGNNMLWEQGRSTIEMKRHLQLHEASVKFLKEKIEEAEADE